MGFVNATGMFTDNYINTPENQYNYLVTDLDNASQLTSDISVGDYAESLISWSWQAFIIGIQTVMAVVIILPWLVLVFHVPIELSIFIQVGIYYTYAIWWSQYRSGKGWKSYE